MKKLLVAILAMILLTSTSIFAATDISATSLDDVISRIDQEIINQIQGDKQELIWAINVLFHYGITKYDDLDWFRGQDNIRRDESAKMYLRFEQEVLSQTNDNPNTSCSFDDLDQAHSDLPDIIKEACHQRLFKGSHGKFMPLANITNAEAITVLVRMIYGEQPELQWQHFAQNYVDKALETDILDNLDISAQSKRELPATRETIARLLYRAQLDYKQK